jgi:receptor expression-enhancing protein 5/6
LNNLEKQTSVPKAYAVIGLVVLYFFLIVFNLGGQLLTNIAGFLIPGYYSLEALFTANKTDDTQWLTVRAASILSSRMHSLTGIFPQYWVVFAFFT